MSCNLVQTIVGSECIGDSRNKINSNFASLETVVCNLSTSPLTTITTPTIQHAYISSTRTLQSNVRDNSINTIHLSDDSVTTSKLSAEAVTTDKIAPDTVRYSQLASWETLSASPTLSAEAVQPRLAKAWVTFNGAAATPTIYSAFNVSSVIDRGVGLYTVNYITPFEETTYAVSSQCDTVDAFTWVFIDNAAFNLIESTQIRTGQLIGSVGSNADSVWISHTVFGN